LLSEPEQRVFRRLAVFADGWTLEATGQVCADDPGETNWIEILPNLVDKSLVVVERFLDQVRYRYLETIRQFAWKKLIQAGEEAEIRDRHLRYFIRWAEGSKPYKAGPGQPGWIECFSAEHDNLRAALTWSQADTSRVEFGLRLAAASGYFWKIRGYLSEGRARLMALLERPAGPPSLPRIRALIWAANMSYLQSDFPAVRPLLEEALALCRGFGQEARLETARILDLLGELATEVGENEKAEPYFEEALSIFEELGDQSGIADMLLQLGWAAMRVGDYPLADRRLNESLPLFQELGETRLIGFALSGLGELAIRQGRYEQAATLLEESLALRREIGERWSIAASLGSLGWAAMLQHDFTRMRSLLGESLALRLELGESGGTAWCLEKLAHGICLEAQNLPASFHLRGLRLAARLFGAAAALRQPLSSTIDPADLPEYETLLESLKSRLGQETFEAEWVQGGFLPLDEILNQAMAPLVTAGEIAAMPASRAAKAKYGGLSSRERQAAVWIARGKTNREIAKLMYVRVGTVETYVTRILNKLGFDSRAQIIAWAYQSGLLDDE
jgi:DNA-binding CsgD family transcriptional regulator